MNSRSTLHHHLHLTGALLAIIIFSLVSPASAQYYNTVRISAPNLAAFPQVSFNLTLYDAAGNFIPDLSSENVLINEAGSTRAVDSLSYLEPGFELIVAVNSGAPLGYDARGGNRYEVLSTVLQEWVAQRTENAIDHYSLVTGAGILAAHQVNNLEWANALITYDPAWPSTNPNLAALASALQLAADPPAAPDLRTAILLITPLPTTNSLASLTQSSDLAAQMEIPVYIWLVGPTAAVNTVEGRALQALADRTAGSLFLFTGDETIPDPEEWFAPLRGLYHAGYQSTLAESGTFALSASIRRADLAMDSSEQLFELTVEPPTPIFADPPGEVTRAWVSPEGEVPFLAPSSTIVNFLIDFTDGHTRDLISSRLLMDGVIVSENTTPPYTSFNWQLEEITETGTHVLQVEVTDILLLEGASQEVNVQTIILARDQSAFQGVLDTVSSWPFLVFVSVLLAGAALAAVLLLSGRKGGLRLPRRTPTREELDPLTQPVAIRQETPRLSRSAGIERITIPRNAQDAPARLVRLSPADLSPITSPPILFSPPEMTFGNDPRMASFVLESGSISPLHARLTQGADGRFTLADAGSEAGTWVNYAPVSKLGAHLEHGDLVHIGKMPFRFEFLRRN